MVGLPLLVIEKYHDRLTSHAGTCSKDFDSFFPIVDLIPLFLLCPLPEEEPPTLDPCLVLFLGSPPPYVLPLLSVDPLPKENPLLLEFCPSSPSPPDPRYDFFLPADSPPNKGEIEAQSATISFFFKIAKETGSLPVQQTQARSLATGAGTRNFNW